MRTAILFACTIPCTACLASFVDPEPTSTSSSSSTSGTLSPTTGTTVDGESTGTTSTSEPEPDTDTLDDTTMPKPPNCGDGIVDADEACDGGGETAECNINCTTSTCGDGIPNTADGEDCDDGAESETCNANCTTAKCGDGIHNTTAEEKCDDGNLDKTDDCTDMCTIAACGDGIQHKNADLEECDDGNMTDTDACTSNCKINICGDGIWNTKPDGEACDDGNEEDGDGCSSMCITERFVFVTSAQYKGNMNFESNNEDNPENLTGIKLADHRCNLLAASVDPPLPGKYKAWLSNNNLSPASDMRFDTSFTGLYRLRSEGFPIVATGWSGLIDKNIDELYLDHPIYADENGVDMINVGVWTGTTPSGQSTQPLMMVNQNCNGWEDADLGATGRFGRSVKKDNEWTEINSAACDQDRHLYCFQDI